MKIEKCIFFLINNIISYLLVILFNLAKININYKICIKVQNSKYVYPYKFEKSRILF